MCQLHVKCDRSCQEILIGLNISVPLVCVKKRRWGLLCFQSLMTTSVLIVIGTYLQCKDVVFFQAKAGFHSSRWVRAFRCASLKLCSEIKSKRVAEWQLGWWQSKQLCWREVWLLWDWGRGETRWGWQGFEGGVDAKTPGPGRCAKQSRTVGRA